MKRIPCPLIFEFFADLPVLPSSVDTDYFTNFVDHNYLTLSATNDHLPTTPPMLQHIIHSTAVGTLQGIRNSSFVQLLLLLQYSQFFQVQNQSQFYHVSWLCRISSVIRSDITHPVVLGQTGIPVVDKVLVRRPRGNFTFICPSFNCHFAKLRL